MATFAQYHKMLRDAAPSIATMKEGYWNDAIVSKIVGMERRTGDRLSENFNEIYDYGYAQVEKYAKKHYPNPRGSRGKFERCVEAVAARGGAYDPRAVCAVQERREIGQRELTRRAVAGKRRAARGNPGFVVGGSQWVGDRAYAKRLAQTFADQSQRPVTVAPVDEKGYAGRVIYTARPKAAKRNPAEAAAEAYKIFNGEPPSRFTTVTERRHEHRFLFSVGNLRSLVVRTIDRTSEVKLKKFGGAFLAGNEQAFKQLSKTGKARAQLYIKDGDQSINLEDFGIDPDKAHEIETLGKVIDVDYETNKVHLGDEGGEAVYHHKFRRTREGDAEVKVHWARYPDLIYYVLDQRMEFSGGSYELIAEGINF